jgi:hypothetical protein
MFGSFKFGKSTTFGPVTIETVQDNGLVMYHRKSDTDITKFISTPSSIIVNPVEPVTQPQEITHYLLIELKSSVLISPHSTLTFFVTFPIEVSVYVSARKVLEQIDSFTLTTPKYTLYGTPDNGLVCKWWKSHVHSTIPEVTPHLEGVMKVKVRNTSDDWMELRKMVFDAYYMKIFYRHIACMNAVMEITNGEARTSFIEQPILEDMKKAVELFKLRKILIIEKDGFLMEWGL